MADNTKVAEKEAHNARQLALVVVNNTTETERRAVSDWLGGLLEIQRGSGRTLEKSRRAIALTAKSKVVWPTAKLIARELKRVGWDERKPATRFAAIGALGGAMVFGGSGAGIAALGTAIGVPLWVVTSAGAAFAATILEELHSSLNRKKDG